MSWPPMKVGPHPVLAQEKVRYVGDHVAVVVAESLADAKSAAELIAAARSRPGSINYASPGVGTPHHLSMELFKNVTGTQIVHVPYKGTAGAITDLLGGQIATMFVPKEMLPPPLVPPSPIDPRGSGSIR